VRRATEYEHNLLMPLGLTIFVLSFVLIASTAGPYLTRPSKIERVSINSANQVQPVTIDMNLASDLMQKRCSKCHNLDRVVGGRKDARGWLTTVNRMRKMPGADISETDAQMIVAYLAAQSPSWNSGTGMQMEVARACGSALRASPHSGSRI
jgi:hypothetical protein